MGSSPGLSLAEKPHHEELPGRFDSAGWALNRPVIREQATEIRKDFDIAAPNIDVQVRLLSGGNLQKAILAPKSKSNPS